MIIIPLFAWVAFAMVNQSICRLYQLSKDHSFNFNDNNSMRYVYNNYKRYGDITKAVYGFRMTPMVDNAFGYFGSKDAVNSNKFELQVTFQTDRLNRYGSLFTIWFYSLDNNPNADTEGGSHTDTDMLLNKMTNDNNYLGFVNQFKGFGIAVITKPKEYTRVKSIIKIIPNPNMTEMPEEEIEEDSKEYSCYEELGNVTRLTVRYNKGDISLFYNSTDSLMTQCLSYKEDDILGDSFKFGLASKNGMISDVALKNSIIVSKVSLFNSDKRQIPRFKSSKNNSNNNKSGDYRSYNEAIEEIYNKRDEASSSSSLSPISLELELNRQIKDIENKHLRTNEIKALSEVIENIVTMGDLINDTIKSIDSNLMHEIEGTNAIGVFNTEAFTNVAMIIASLNTDQNVTDKALIEEELTEITLNINEMEETNKLLQRYYQKEIATIENAFHSNADTYYYHYLILCLLMCFQFIFILWINHKIN